MMTINHQNIYLLLKLIRPELYYWTSIDSSNSILLNPSLKDKCTVPNPSEMEIRLCTYTL